LPRATSDQHRIIRSDKVARQNNELDQYGFGLNRQIQPKPMKLIAKIVLEPVRDNASRSSAFYVSASERKML
jgi:hypothetical protein